MANDAGSQPKGAIIISFPAAPRMSDQNGPSELVPFNFRVEPEFRREFTDFCRRHNLGRREALHRAFELLRQEFED